MVRLHALLIIGLLCGSCAVHPVEPPRATSIVLSRNMRWGVIAWEREAATRFYRPIIVYVHGGPDERGKWWCKPDVGPELPVEGVARLLRLLYPGRPIVLVSCNGGHAELHGMPDVWYARDIVWSNPHEQKGGVGRIRDFVQGN